MAKNKQAASESPQSNDLSILARVFVRYRSGLDITFPECREIIALFNAQGVDIVGMGDSEILATWGGEYHQGHIFTSGELVPTEVFEEVFPPDEPHDFSVGDIEPTPVADDENTKDAE